MNWTKQGITEHFLFLTRAASREVSEEHQSVCKTVGQAMHRSLAKIHSQGGGYSIFHFILFCFCFSAPWSISRSGSNLNTCGVETITRHHWEGRDSTNTQSRQDLEKNQGSAYLGGHSLPSARILVIMPQTYICLYALSSRSPLRLVELVARWVWGTAVTQ